MKKKIGLVAGCMLFIIMISSTSTYSASREGGILTVRWWEQPRYIEMLGLSDQQIDRMREKYLKESGKLNKIRTIRISLIKELTDEQRTKFRETDKRKYSDRYR